MNKCIVRNLDVDINNNNLEFIDGLYLEINTESPKQRLISITPLEDAQLTIEVIGDGDITNEDGSVVYGKQHTISYTLPFGSTNLSFTTNTNAILIRDCSKLKDIGNIYGKPTCFVATLDRFKRCVNATSLRCSNMGDFTGNIIELSPLTKINDLHFYLAQISGTWEEFIENQVKLGRRGGEISIRIDGVLFNGASLSNSARIIYSEDKVEVFDEDTLKGTYQNSSWSYV